VAELYRRAFLLELKAIDDTAGRRRIRGTASTPKPDRQKHILEVAGATFAAEIPLLLHHHRETPVGVARLRKGKDAITFEAELPVIDEAGPVKDEVDRAWTSITSEPPLIKGVSVGWRPIDDASIELRADGTVRFHKSEICELSLVTVPANVDATIDRVAALDVAYRAAAGLTTEPGDAGAIPLLRSSRAPGAAMTTQTVGEQIQSYEATRAAKQARMVAIMTAAAEAHQTLDGTQAEEHDTLRGEIDRIDQDLVRWRALEKSLVTTATPVPATANGRPAVPVKPISVKSNAMPGAVFTRAMLAHLACYGKNMDVVQYAAQRWPEAPEVALHVKAAVAPGTTTGVGWAAELVGATAEFVALLWPRTAIGQITGMQKVPWNIKVPAQTGGGTYNWTGEGKPKPVTSLVFASFVLPIAKATGIIVMTKELAMSSSPSAEELARDSMIKGITKFVDQQFIDPAVAAVANVNPASITNGVTPLSSIGPLSDIVQIASAFTAAGLPIDGLTYIMSPSNALILSFQRETTGALRFPDLSVGGGTVNGLKVVTSAAAGSNVIGLLPQLILYNDEGGVTVDVSQEASLQMDSAPASPADATTVYRSLWQENLIGLRAEWFISWLKANANAVKYVNNAGYTIPAPQAMEAPAAEGKNGKK
jgi:HK97 family phage major capsid protein